MNTSEIRARAERLGYINNMLYVEAHATEIIGLMHDSASDTVALLGALEAKERELSEYRTAEEQGLLIRLPCKVGDTIYRVIRHCTESEFGDCVGCQRNTNGICRPEFFEQVFSVGLFDQIGKTVFLTREEAEAALEEQK